MDAPIKEFDMRQVGDELARLQKAFVDRINRVRFYHLLAVLYIGIALAIILSPQQATMGWLLGSYGIKGNFLSFLFVGSAIVIASNPPKRWFAVCLTPLAIYLLIFSAYTLNTNHFALQVGFWYIGGLIALIWTLQFNSLGKLKLTHVLSFIMAMMGIAVFDSPARGVVGWISQSYSASAQALGFVLIFSALWMAVNPKRGSFWTQVSGLSLYVGSSVVFSMQSPSGGLVGVAIATTFAVSLLWMYRHLDKYYEVQ